MAALALAAVEGPGTAVELLFDLRHTHVSQLLKQGNDLLLVSRRLGHSQVSTTANIYAHLLPGVEEEAMRKLEITMQAAEAGL